MIISHFSLRRVFFITRWMSLVRKKFKPWFLRTKPDYQLFQGLNEEIQVWNVSFEKAVLLLRLILLMSDFGKGRDWVSIFRKILYDIYFLQTHWHVDFDHYYSAIFFTEIKTFYAKLITEILISLIELFQRCFQTIENSRFKFVVQPRGDARGYKRRRLYIKKFLRKTTNYTNAKEAIWQFGWPYSLKTAIPKKLEIDLRYS